jgi:hypothetical protein
MKENDLEKMDVRKGNYKPFFQLLVKDIRKTDEKDVIESR